jgi:hypothetical protein
MLFDNLHDRFQLRLRDRTTAANILGGALKNIIRRAKVELNCLRHSKRRSNRRYYNKKAFL